MSIVIAAHATYGEVYGPAMNVQTEAEAKEYFDAIMKSLMEHHGKSEETAADIVKSNLGYWTGYCDSETARRVFRLYGCAHPIFGVSRPSAEEAFDAGKKMAEKP